MTPPPAREGGFVTVTDYPPRGGIDFLGQIFQKLPVLTLIMFYHRNIVDEHSRRPRHQPNSLVRPPFKPTIEKLFFLKSYLNESKHDSDMFWSCLGRRGVFVDDISSIEYDLDSKNVFLGIKKISGGICRSYEPGASGKYSTENRFEEWIFITFESKSVLSFRN